MNRKRIALLLGAVIAAIMAAFAVWRDDSAPQDRISAMVTSPADALHSAETAPPVQVDAGAPQYDDQSETNDSLGAPLTVLSLRQQFLGADDYAAFIASIVSVAEAGNMDAQYYVYAALSYCDKEFRALFRRRNGSGWRTLDEALQRAAGKPEQSLESVESVDRKCRKLMEGGRDELGDSRRWLQNAASSGQPLALTALAESQLVGRLVDRERENATKSDSALDSMSVKDLLEAALKSKDPEVLWKIGDMQGLLSGNSEESTMAQWAWRLAACERGYECGPGSPWLEFSCRFDQMCGPGENAIDYMKRTLQTDFPVVEGLAREINANIDAGAWSALDIGG